MILEPFQARFLKAATAPNIHLAALSLPRGNGKSRLAAFLIERILTPGGFVVPAWNRIGFGCGEHRTSENLFPICEGRTRADWRISLCGLRDALRDHPRSDRHALEDHRLERKNSNGPCQLSVGYL